MSLKIKFPKLTQWQSEVFISMSVDNKDKTYIIKSGRQRGKNFLINIVLISYALQHPGSTSVLIEPVSAQCRRVHRQIANALADKDILEAANSSTLEIFFKNKSSIIFKSGEQRDSIRGLTCSGICVIDECAYIPDDVIEIILPLVNVNHCPKLLTSTPLFAEGYFYEQWMSEDTDIYHFDWALDKYDMSDFISEKQIEQYRKSYSPQRFLTEIIGDFCTDNSFVFGDFKSCIKEPTCTVSEYAGIDWSAGTGNDSTVLTLMDRDGNVTDIWSTNIMDASEQIEEIAKRLNEIPTLRAVYVEMNSIGKIYHDTLLKKLNNKSMLHPFYTTNDSKREIIESLIMGFQNMRIGILNDSNLVKQLSYYEMQKTKTGYTYNNDNPNHHDDYVISLALAYKAKNDWQYASSSGFRFSSK